MYQTSENKDLNKPEWPLVCCPLHHFIAAKLKRCVKIIFSFDTSLQLTLTVTGHLSSLWPDLIYRSTDNITK